MIYSALLSLTATLVAKASLPELKNYHSKSHLDPESPGFETSNLKSWKVISGTAFSKDSISSDASYRDNGKPLLKQIAINNKALGQKGHINIADIRVGCHVLGDGKGLSFNILGQANQVPQSYSACSSYAADSIRPQYH
ncbi:hypothetical protein IWW34DRAFT_807077 [Fusarium oxysporum f. sp. albedinis]|nr:hypothetical protein IWW34DRAFT_807077 [Fusarium oxysporum f. sp. albedinis]